MDVLIVDNDVDNAAFITRLLKLKFPSLSVSAASTSDIELERVHADSPILALMELHTPGIGGLELARRLQDRYGSGVRIVIITDENSNLIPKEAIDGVLSRPFSLDALYHLVNTFHRKSVECDA